MGISQTEYESQQKTKNIPASDQNRIAEVFARHEQILLNIDWSA